MLLRVTCRTLQVEETDDGLHTLKRSKEPVSVVDMGWTCRGLYRAGQDRSERVFVPAEWSFLGE